jgi:hypothetical protein
MKTSMTIRALLTGGIANAIVVSLLLCRNDAETIEPGHVVSGRIGNASGYRVDSGLSGSGQYPFLYARQFCWYRKNTESVTNTGYWVGTQAIDPVINSATYSYFRTTGNVLGDL